jgi:hypothetical protein
VYIYIHVWQKVKSAEHVYVCETLNTSTLLFVQVLPGVRPAMLEMLSSYYRALPLHSHAPSTEVTTALVRAVSEEVTDAIKQVRAPFSDSDSA